MLCIKKTKIAYLYDLAQPVEETDFPHVRVRYRLDRKSSIDDGKALLPAG